MIFNGNRKKPNEIRIAGEKAVCYIGIITSCKEALGC